MAEHEDAQTGPGCRRVDYSARYYNGGNWPEHRQRLYAEKHSPAAGLSGQEVDAHIRAGWPPAEGAGRLEGRRAASDELLSGGGRLDIYVDEVGSRDPSS